MGVTAMIFVLSFYFKSTSDKLTVVNITKPNWRLNVLWDDLNLSISYLACVLNCIPLLTNMIIDL